MASDQVPDRWVRLNVGGRIFLTMKQTLSRSPFFARLFEADDRKPSAMGSSSTHFIDRDPDCFSKVLNYLRYGTLFVDKGCYLGKLRREAVSYGLDDLVSTINEAKAHMSSDEVPGGWVRLYTPRHKHHLMRRNKLSFLNLFK